MLLSAVECGGVWRIVVIYNRMWTIMVIYDVVVEFFYKVVECG